MHEKEIEKLHSEYYGEDSDYTSKDGVTEVTPPLENTRFSPFFDFTVLRPPAHAGAFF